MSEGSPRFCSWWTPELGVTIWHYYVRVHGNTASSRVWVHGTVITTLGEYGLSCL